MSFRSKRELLAQVAPRYQRAGHTQKSVILDEFVAATGYARKYAIQLLAQPPLPVPAAIRRPRAPRYGAAVQTANDGEFINTDLVAYCDQEQITFTRSRPYQKNDQCFVEQKNGAVVRQFVGYDRFEGEAAYRQLVELYRALRLYINFFQPSVKLKEKRREGTHVRRSYAPAQTPFERLGATAVVPEERRARLDAIFTALDPIRLLDQIGWLQEALWQHAIVRTAPITDQQSEVPVRFAAAACGLTEHPTPVDPPLPPIVHHKRI